MQLQIKQMKDLLILEKKNMADELKDLRSQFKLKELEDGKAMKEFHNEKFKSLNHLKERRRK